jgi:long-chain acyl-CoA synthetase
VLREVCIFDVDGTLVDSLTGTSLRPGSVELLTRLRAAGHVTILWSAGGATYARERAGEHGVVALFDAFHPKDERDAEGRYRPAFIPGLDSAVFIDDRPEDMPVGAHVIAVSPYIAHNPHDRGLAKVVALFGEAS